MTINKKKHIILSLLYHYRCLSLDQIYKQVFEREHLSIKTCLNTLSSLQNQEKMIVKVGYYKEDSYYIISSSGINFLKKYGIFGINPLDWNGVEFKKLLSTSKIVLKESKVKHQISLNQFVMEFVSQYPNYLDEYYDEKDISTFISNIMPDGLIKSGNTLYFLEADMNTERKSRLIKKWDSYRNFIHSESFYNSMTYDIKVLFILDNISRKSSRKNQLMEYIDTNLRSEISYKFNIYIGKSDELLDILGKELNDNKINIANEFQKKGFNVSKGVFNYPEMSDISFDNYIFKSEENQLVSENGIIMDFVVDDYTDENMYVYKKVQLLSEWEFLLEKLL